MIQAPQSTGILRLIFRAAKFLGLLLLYTQFSSAAQLPEPKPKPGTFSLSDLSLQSELSRIKGDFQQQKFLRNFRKPLVSSGSFAFDANSGTLNWEVKKPIVTSIYLDKHRLIQKDAYGNSQTLSTETNPVIQMISEIFISLMALDTSRLEKNFAMDLQGQAQAWRLKLKPKTGTLEKVFSRIELEGSTYIKRLTIEDARGEKTLIDFTPIAP